MLVVSDTSSVRTLRVLDCAHVLPILFGHILIPHAVLKELQHPNAPAVVRTWLADPPVWLEVRSIVGRPDAALAMLEHESLPAPSPAGGGGPAGGRRPPGAGWQAAARSGLAPRVARRTGPQSQPPVARTDGAAAVPPPVGPHVPAYTVRLALLQPRSLGGRRPTPCWGPPSPRAPRGYAPLWRPCWRGRSPPGSRRWRPRGLLPPRRPRHDRRGGGQGATPHGTNPLGPPRPLGRGAGPSAPGCSRGPVDLWGRTVWSRRGGAGRQPGRRPCVTCGPCASTGSGRGLGHGLGTRRIRRGMPG
jgi:hypothetical protein